jgi:hypothetical protein
MHGGQGLAGEGRGVTGATGCYRYHEQPRAKNKALSSFSRLNGLKQPQTASNGIAIGRLSTSSGLDLPCVAVRLVLCSDRTEYVAGSAGRCRTIW